MRKAGDERGEVELKVSGYLLREGDVSVGKALSDANDPGREVA